MPHTRVAPVPIIAHCTGCHGGGYRHLCFLSQHWWCAMSIKFTLPEPLFSSIPEPLPASKCIPDWWSDTPLSKTDEYGEVHTSRTVRGCMPFLDAMSMGWILRLPQDLSIRANKDGVSFDHGSVSDDKEPVVPFGTDKLPNTPESLPDDIIPLKLNTYWLIDGHKGSKAWVMPPRNRFDTALFSNIFFTSGVYSIDSTYIDSGIVVFLNPAEDLEVYLRAGTAIAQVVFLDDTGLINDASIVPMSEEMKHKAAVADTRTAVNNHLYQEEHWDPIGRAKLTPDDQGSSCPFGYGDEDQ